jgi:hypothetical protein
MKRLGIAGSCLALALVLTATAATPASAFPTFSGGHICSNVGPKNGHYDRKNSNTECGELLAGKGGEWELLEPTFTATSGTSILTAATEAVTCSSSAGHGAVEGSDSFVDSVVTFSGCFLKNAKGTCTIKSTNTSTSGLVVTNSLRGLLGEVASAEATSKVGALLEPESGVTFVILEKTAAPCESIETAVEGTVAGEMTPIGASQTTGKLAFLLSASKQRIKEITLLAGTKKPKLAAFGIATATEETTDALTYSGAVEVT